MDINKLIRDKNKVYAKLKEAHDGSLVCLAPTKIHIPARFETRGMLNVGKDVFSLAIIPIIIEEKYYAILNILSMAQLQPLTIQKISIDDVEYYELGFEPGCVLFKTKNVVKNADLVYLAFDELVQKGNVPWYMDYEDMGRIFDSAKRYAGVNIGSNPEITSLIISLISRQKSDLTKYYRHGLKTFADLTKSKAEFIPLKSVIYNATGTLDRIAGSYMSDGVVSSLVMPTKESDQIEKLLRA